MSPMDQDKDNFQFSEEKRAYQQQVYRHQSMLSGAYGHQGQGHGLHQHQHGHPHHGHAHHSHAHAHAPAGSTIATMGLSNGGVVMMCTNQRVYEHSGGITGTFYPPVATSQDNQHLYQSSSSSATTTAGSSGGGGGGGQATPTYLSAGSGYPGAGAGAGSSSPHYGHHARVADAYQGGVMMADDRYSQQQQQQQHVGYACAGEEEDLMLAGDGVDTHEFDKYLGARLHAHHAPPPEPMDSNHNYHHQHQQQQHQQLHAAYYGQPSALDGLGGLLKAEPAAGLSLAPYDGQACVPQDFSDHHHHAAAAAAATPAQHIKTEDDFSVILENVRKTCYST